MRTPPCACSGRGRITTCLRARLAHLQTLARSQKAVFIQV